MLAEEGLIPEKPLAGAELGDAWTRSETVIRRYLDYFRACRDAVAEALDATPHPNRSSATQSYVYQDFETKQGEFIGIGLWSSDKIWTSSKAHRKAPVVWTTIDAANWRNWEAAQIRLEASPPPGWTVEPLRWYARPTVWRYLDDIVGAGTFDEQRARFAESCAEARSWFESVRTRRPSRRS
jgi:hypothetical protein